ncbi:YxeA family protein [Bacillus thuringiensis]|uniref:YxeA family protein n=1 Tax=Bacillus thuringiensis TaxID=1428 RepID=UPI001FABE5D9|nr:YxeA family protein [Bacillus thuringiensis]MDM8364429.1 YxeA family protein [Bacillus thuringiensis]
MRLTVPSIIFFILFTVFLTGCDYNRIWKDEYYVQILGQGKEKNEKFNTGEPYRYYEYELKGFDKNGTEKTMLFTAQKQLREHAFLRVYHNGEVVTAWEEVKQKDLPNKVKQKLNVT